MRLKEHISTHLWLRTLERHPSRMGRVDAPRYTAYAERAQAAFDGPPADPETDAAAASFRQQGFAWLHNDETETLARAMRERLKMEEAEFGEDAVWAADTRYSLGDIYQRFPEVEALFRGTTGNFLRAAFGSEFKIFYGILYRSRHDPDGPTGSQRWHSDAGPGTCINLMFCLTEVGPENGAMEILPWPESLQLFRREARERARHPMSSADVRDFYDREIPNGFAGAVCQPSFGPGLVYPFINNTVHRGGYPDAGQERIVCVFHVYPSIDPAPLGRYRETGIAKSGPYPDDPAWQ